MISILIVIACAALYAVKGGQHGRFKRMGGNALGISYDSKGNPIGKLHLDQRIYQFLTDGKTISTLGFSLLCLNPLAGLAWLVGVAPSMGEEAGAVGGYKGNWRPEGATWGWKRGLQRGVFLGAMLALALNDTLMIIAGASFPLCYFLGISIQQYRTGKIIADWHLAEWIYGAVVGVALAYHLI